ncbi:MAG: TetR family transcriptional regulator [Actinomycetota bacterium]|nr:TetR family transcriptional regulator [Actinomycetota bacterium]
MALSRPQIIDAALEVLRTYGLADLSMRRLARDLGVQPGALYWHVKNKQELLGALAQQILANVPDTEPAAPAEEAVRQTALSIRTALLSVRDGADVVSLAQALDPTSLAPIRKLHAQLAQSASSAEHARWGARVLTHYLLGAVAEEQTQTDLARAGLLPAGTEEESAEEAFTFGVDTILHGLHARNN